MAMYFWYLNCPRCLLEHGAKRIILLAQSSRVLAMSACTGPLGPSTRGQFVPCGV